MKCPECGSAEIRDSKRSRLSDVLERLRGKGAFRCRVCHKRFYAAQSNGAGFKEVLLLMRNQRSTSRLNARTRRRLMHNLVVIAIFSMAFILFWLFLRYIIAEASPAQNSGVIGSSFRVDRSSRGDPGNLLNGSGPAS